MKKTIKSVLVGALVALLGSSAFAEIRADKNPVPKVGIGDAGAVTITLTSTEASDQSLSFSGSSAAATHWQNNYISVDLSSSTISGNGGTITATIKGLKETGNAQTFSIYRANRTNKYLDITVTKVEKGTEEIDCGDVFISHGQTLILTNDQNEAILWGKVKEDSSSSSNKDIATLTSSNVNDVAYAAVKNPVRDGTAKLVVAIEGTNYNFTVHAMTVEIEKTVKAASENPDTPNDKSNATIRVTTHVLYNVHEIPTNKILYVGSTCTSHTLSKDKVVKNLNALATKGAVHWALFGVSRSQASVAQQEGDILMSNEVTSAQITASFTSSMHRNLKAYLTYLDGKIDAEHKNFDYIVLSFDGGRLMIEYSGDDTSLNDRVAKKLAWYYNNDRVIWIRDTAAGDDRYEQYGSEYYRPASTHDDGYVTDKATWEAFVALMDPVTYTNKPSGSRYTATKSVSGGTTVWAANRLSAQESYEDPNKVAKLLDANIKVATYDTKLVDNVLDLNNSLSIVKTGSDTSEVHFYTWAGKSAPVAPEGGVIADLPKDNTKGDGMYWKAEPESAFKVNGYEVTANVSNITQETWNMFEISIVDNGTFLQECLKYDAEHPDEEPKKAVLDPETGKYLVNPNDGPAHVTLYSEEGGREIQVQSVAKATTVLWPFDLIPLKIYVDDATVTYGDDVPTTLGWKSGAARYDLPNVDESKINGLNTVTFGTDYTKGSPVGYQRYTINTNSTGLSSAYYAITVVPGTLTVKKATIRPVKPGENPPEDGSPYTKAPDIVKTYDGEGTNITAEVFNVDDTMDVPTFLYSLDENGPFEPQVSIRDVELDGEDVTSNKVWYTVTTKTAGDDENYFAATNFAWILIKPRPVTLTAASESWPYDGCEHKTNGYSVAAGSSFVAGEGLKSDKFTAMTSASVITDVGEVANEIDKDALEPNAVTSLDNYDIKLVSGKLMVSRVDLKPSQVWAEDAIKVYDGANKTNIVVKFGAGMDASKFVVEYAADASCVTDDVRTAGFTMVRPVDAPEDTEFSADFKGFQDSCTNKVWFRVTEKENYSEGDEKGNYSNYYGYAWVKIAPRPVHFSFPKAVKPYDGNANYSTGLSTNLVKATHGESAQGPDHGMVGSEKFVCTATGAFTGSNVRDAADYFQLGTVTITGERNAFKRNYVITYDGEGTGLVPGAITALPIDPVEPADPGDNPDDEPDPTDGPTIWARNVVKVYDGVGTNVIAKVYNAVNGNTFTYEYSTNKIDFVAWDALQFTNVVAEQKVWYRAMTAQGNYLGVTNFAFVTITPAPIQAVPEGDDPDDPTKPWAQATSVEVWTNDWPSVLGGTNITVDVELYTGDEPTLEYSCDLVSWKTDAEMKKILNHILATQVWCRVSCEPNYVSTNVTSYVYIKSKESKPDDEEADPPTPGNPGDKLQPNPDTTKPTTEEQTKKVVEAITANDNRLPVGTGPGKYDPSKPAWDGEGTLSGGDHGIQTDAKVNLKVTSLGKLPEDEKKDAEDHLAEEIADAQRRSDVDPTSVKGRSIDVKLLYTRTYSDGTPIEENIGASNTEIIPFTIAVALAEDEQILKVVRYHGEARDEIHEGTDPTTEHFELSAGRKYVTVYAKTYSEFIIIQGTLKKSDQTFGDFPVEVYDYKANVKHAYLKPVSASSILGEKLVKSIRLYVKYTRTSALRGYIVQDVGGALAANERGEARTSLPAIAAKDAQPGNRCFLVVKNTKTEKGYQMPRIIPGVLDVKWYNDKLQIVKALPAQGYLSVGGEVVADAGDFTGFAGTAFTPKFDGLDYGRTRLFSDFQRLPSGDNTEVESEETRTEEFGLDDYFFTSSYLFGKYNQPTWSGNALEEFADCWMNHAGLGKIAYDPGWSSYCCGRGSGQAGSYVLDSLTGKLKAGFYLCTENGEDEAHSMGYERMGILEDQLWLEAGANNPDTETTKAFAYLTAGGDSRKLDIWADAGLDLRTSDVGYGDWKIKRNTTIRGEELSDDEKDQIKAWGFWVPGDTMNLMTVIKSTMLKLSTSAKLFGNPVDGNEMINYSFFRSYLAEGQEN